MLGLNPASRKARLSIETLICPKSCIWSQNSDSVASFEHQASLAGAHRAVGLLM